MSLKDSVVEYLKLDQLKENIVKLIEAKFELKKIEIQENIESRIAGLFVKALVAAFLFTAFVLLNVLTANLLNAFFNNSYIGYLLLVVLYVLIAFLVFSIRKPIERVIQDVIKKEMDKSDF